MITSQDKYSIVLNLIYFSFILLLISCGAKSHFFIPFYLITCGIPSALMAIMRHKSDLSPTQPQKAITAPIAAPMNNVVQLPKQLNIKKPVLWDGKNLRGTWTATRKADGVRATVINDQVLTTGGNPWPISLQQMKGAKDAEIYFGDWYTSIKAMRGQVEVNPENVYPLDTPDPRLMIGSLTNPTAEQITDLLNQVVLAGWEGLVLRQGDTWIKVKKSETHDLEIIAINYNKNKTVKSLVTCMGSVASGLTNEQKAEIKRNPKAYIGKIIEVSALSTTANGKLREPRLERFRDDKGAK